MNRFPSRIFERLILRYMNMTVRQIVLRSCILALLFIPISESVCQLPYIGEIRPVALSYAPNGWLICDGSLLPISEYETLFTLIGTTYGGDGDSTFGIPDLRGRTPIHQGQGSGLQSRILGETGGAESHTLTVAQMASHTHSQNSDSAIGKTHKAKNNIPAKNSSGIPTYGNSASASLPAGSVSSVGGGQPLDLAAPSLTINYIIAVYGIFPSPSETSPRDSVDFRTNEDK